MVSNPMRWFLRVFFFIFTAGLSAQVVKVGGREFARSPSESGAKGEWVVYEKGVPQNEATRRWLTKKVLVELTPGARASDLRKVAGVSTATERGKYAVVEFSGNADAGLIGVDRLRRVKGVQSAEPMLARQLYRRSVPNDPLFAHGAGRPGYQWHLRNTGENGAKLGMDLNVTNVWDTYRGGGVKIAIVDDGLEVGHADLIANVDTALDYDFNGADADPSPGADDFHGTACAGVAAARGNNGIGVSGVAPESTLVGLRLISAPTTDDVEASAFTHEQAAIAIKSNSWGPYDGAFGAGGPGPLSLAAMESAATTGRGGKGTVFLWAAGNGNGSGDDSNFDGWANSPYAIAVSAMNDKGEQSWYSEPGANILVCAPSSGGKQGITTTDRSGNVGYNEGESTPEFPDYAETSYTNTFGGTSSSTPAVAGVVALMLEANPNLTYRDVQEILVRTAVKNDEFDGGWVQNGAGFHFNHQYGAGLVNAQAAVSMATGWTTVLPRQQRQIAQLALAEPIPDANESGVSRTFSVPLGDNLRLEHVTVKVKATHPYVGQLEWRLKSPSGVSVRLARARFNDTSENLDWTFMAAHFWGEHSVGDWKLEVIDRTVDHVGVLNEATITFYGTPTSPALPLPVLTSSWIIVGREGWPVNHQMTASNSPTLFGAGRSDFGGAIRYSMPAGLSLNPTTGLITGMPLETGLWEGYQDVTNATGTSSEYTYFYILAASPSLSLAVEQTADTKIVPFGFGDFFSQTAITHDGIDAAQSGDVNDEEHSGMEFTVTGPAALSFQWKVSSEKNYDYLVLVVDGYLKGYISGEVDWTEVTTYVGPGDHNVDIYYLKDRAESKGQDTGWVDELVITPTTTLPVVKVETVYAYQNVYLRHSLEATNAPSSYTAVGLPSGLTLHPETGLIYGSTNLLGTFTVTVTATNTLGTSAAAEIIVEVGTVGQGLATVLDAPTFTFTSSGDEPWIPQFLYAQDGRDAARSGKIDNEQSSVMTTQVEGPCKVTFYWGVSSEKDYDFLRFYIDEVEQEAISGEVGWTRKNYWLGAGVHTLKWEYRKDQFTQSGLDSGFVDQLQTHLDLDGDGFHSDLETHFGTSDGDPSQFPRTTLAVGTTGATFEFPSKIGESYRIEYSDNLTKWTPVIIEATGASTTWTDTAAQTKSRRFYRVLIP